MIRSLSIVAISILTLASVNFSFAEQMTPIQHITAPGGKVTYYIVSSNNRTHDDPPITAIVLREKGENKIILRESLSPDPEKNLSGFYNMYLSPDAKELFFNSEAWATSGAIHSINVSTGKTKYISPGELACVILSGEYQGDLIVAKHKYFVQGGSYENLYLVDLSGKEIGIVAQGTDKSSVCPTLGQG
ncbi:hypothetical protein ACRZZR_000771 [Edwardsiella piscicida]